MLALHYSFAEGEIIDIMLQKMDEKLFKLIFCIILFHFIYSCWTKLPLAFLHSPVDWPSSARLEHDMHYVRHFTLKYFQLRCSASSCTALLASWLAWGRWFITSELKRTIRPYQQIRALAVGAQLALAPVICGRAGTQPQPAAAPWPLQTLKSHRGHRHAPGAGAFIHISGQWIEMGGK